MPIETIASTELVYHLIAFDAEARERNDDADGRMTERSQEALADGSVTDVFLMSHGWMGDIPAARKQYSAWIEAMAANEADLNRTLQARSGFRPLMIGLHWPSLPFGEEALGGSEVSFAAGAPTPDGDATVSATPMEQLVDEYAQTLADTPAARQALGTIIQAAMEDIAPAKMPPHVIQAYEVLNRESALGSEGVGSAPGADREPFDPEATFRDAEQHGARGLGPDAEDMEMLSVEENYFFTPGKVYNLESSHVIREGGGLSGAHNDISRPEVAHAVWQAAFADLS